MATINKVDTMRDGLMLTTAQTNKAPMTSETNKADAVHSVMDQCTHVARTANIDNSRERLNGNVESVSVSTLNRSTNRPSLPVSTLKIAPIPVNRNTGATAN